MIDFSKLNQSQLRAVKTLEGPVLCIAGAGSGKTTTLTYRVANLIDNNINPSSILLLTFTKKAAKDMQNRINSILGVKAKQVLSGTFHHFANLMLNKYINETNIKPNFSVIDENDAGDIIQSLRNNGNTAEKFNQTRFNKNIIYQIISKSRNNSTKLSETIKKDYSKYCIDEKYICSIYKYFTKYKIDNNILDYDDLLESLYKLLLIPKIRQEISNQFKFIMIDEYQDTNKIQAAIVKLLASEHNNVMVVGDDAQSIYSFRGSRIENIQNFKKEYKDCKTILLEENYRSYGNILKGCNSLISKSKICIKKKLFTQKQDGNKIILVKCSSEEEEAHLVAHRILQLYNSGYSLNDIAVLFRNSNHSYQLELELAKRAIPYKKAGGSKIFDSEHIRNVISYLRILNNPYDRISWIKILMMIKGIGIQSASTIFEIIKNQDDPFKLTGFKANSEITNRLAKLSELLLKCVKYFNKEPLVLLNFIVDYYLGIIKQIKTSEELTKIIKDLDQITLVASKYTNLQELLNEIFLDKPDNETDVSNSHKNESMKLTLSTIHSAKGLEWKQVFIISALDGRLPSISSVKNSDELEEERRLMYVAMTRAMEGLMITYPSGIFDKSTREFLSNQSRFINEISPENIEVWQIKH